MSDNVPPLCACGCKKLTKLSKKSKEGKLVFTKFLPGHGGHPVLSRREFTCKRCGKVFEKKWRPSEAKKYGRDGYEFCSRRCSDNRLTLNEQAFDSELSPEAFYWLGFLLGDGNICQDRLTCGLTACDVEHLVKLARFLGLSRERVSMRTLSSSKFGKTSDCAWLSVRSKHLCDRLKELGLEENKSTREVVLPQFRGNIDVLRGLIDADGCVCFTSGATALGLCGSHNVCAVLQEWANRIGSFPKISRQGAIFTCKVSAGPAKKLLNLLYYPDCLALDRKESKAREILSSKKIHEKPQQSDR
jgi:hypothetical protein